MEYATVCQKYLSASQIHLVTVYISSNRCCLNCCIPKERNKRRKIKSAESILRKMLAQKSLPSPPVSWSCTLLQFLEGATIEVDQIHTHMRPLLMMLGDYRSLTLNVVNRLTSVTRLFPNSFNDKFCDQMMVSPSKFLF